MSQDAPSNAGELVGERDGEDVVMQSLLRRFDPRLEPIALPMLWPDPDQHHPGRLDEQGAQIAIASLRYAAEDCSVSGRDLFRYQPKPRAKVAAFRERISSADRGHHSTRDDRPNAGYGHQPLAALILPRQCFDFAGYALDALIEPLRRGSGGSIYTRKAHETREAPKRGQRRPTGGPVRDRPDALGWRRGS